MIRELESNVPMKGIKENVQQFLVDELIQKFEDNIALVVGSKVTDYDAEWCPADYSAIDDTALDNAREAYVNELIDILFQDAPSNKTESKAVVTEGVKDIVASIKQYFKSNQDKKEIKRILNSIKSNGNNIDAFFNELVPAQGKAATKAGELVRAMMRLLYRDFNDGDVYFDGYGIETCGPAASYLNEQGFYDLDDFACDHADDHIHDNPQFDKKYTEFLNDLANTVIKYIEDNPQLLIEPNDEDMLEYPTDGWEAYEPKYDYEVELPESIQEYIRAGELSLASVVGEIQM